MKVKVKKIAPFTLYLNYMSYLDCLCFVIQGTSDWYTLEKIKTGKIQLRCQVIAKDTLVGSEVLYYL